MTDIGELVVRIRADAAQLQQALKDAESATNDSTEHMGKAFESLKEQILELAPELTAAAFVEYGRSAIDAATNLQNMADRIGFSASTLSALQGKLAETGTDVNQFAMSMNLMNVQIGMAAQGDAAAIQKFDQLGLSVTKLLQMNTEDRFYAVADALAQVGDQAEFAEIGHTLLGRSSAALNQLIKEGNGDLGEHVQHLKDIGDAMSDEEIKRVHDFGTALEDAGIKAKNSFIEALAYILQVNDQITRIINKPTDYTTAKTGLTAEQLNPPVTQNPNVSTVRPDSTTTARFLQELSGPLVPTRDAKGNNNDRTGGGDKGPEVTDQVAAYIQNLQDEVDALNKSQLALDVYRAQKEAATKALTDFNNGLRDSKDLTDDEKDSIALSVDELYIQKQAIKEVADEHQKQIQVVAQMESQIASSLADTALNYKNFGTTVSNVLQQIAKEMLEMEITQPLVKSVAGSLGGSFSGLLGGSGASANESISPELAAADPSLVSSGSSFFSNLGFAAGGNPPVGQASMVGENGPELFVPNTAGTVIPNHALGGQNIIVNQTFNMQPGLAETVGAAIRQAAPAIAAQAHTSVINAVRSGGSESRILGLRN